MIQIKTDIIERPGEQVGMIAMPGETVITAWMYDNGHLHGTQCDFPLGTDATTICEAVWSKHEKQLRAFRRLDEEWGEKHGTL